MRYSKTHIRTRAVIITAGVRVLTQDPNAPLEKIAEAAQVGRSTLHRYFKNRQTFLAAIDADCLQRIHQAIERASLTSGSGLEALKRLCGELFEAGDILLLAARLPQLLSGDSNQGMVDERIADTVQRGHHDNTVEALFDASWIQNLLWTLIYAGWDHMRTGSIPKHECLMLTLKTFESAIRAENT